jgi:hypothetical protein
MTRTETPAELGAEEWERERGVDDSMSMLREANTVARAAVRAGQLLSVSDGQARPTTASAPPASSVRPWRCWPRTDRWPQAARSRQLWPRALVLDPAVCGGAPHKAQLADQTILSGIFDLVS